MDIRDVDLIRSANDKGSCINGSDRFEYSLSTVKFRVRETSCPETLRNVEIPFEEFFRSGKPTQLDVTITRHIEASFQVK